MNTGNIVLLGPKPILLQTPGSVGLQGVQDDVTTQTKPLGCHQTDFGIVIPTCQGRSWGKLYQAMPK